MRRGLEAMFEDFKSRGFSITQHQIKRPDRLSGLIGVRAIAMYRAVSTRKAQEHDGKQGGEKGGPKSPKVLMLALQSWAPRHLEMSRWLRQNLQTLGGLDPLKGGKNLSPTILAARHRAKHGQARIASFRSSPVRFFAGQQKIWPLIVLSCCTAN